MEIVLLLLRQITIMFIYMAIGFVLFKKKIISLQGCADLGRMLLYVVMPCAIIRSYLTDYSREKLGALAVSFFLALLSLILAILLGRVFFHGDQPLERFSAAFSNAGFIGIPLVQMTLGEDAVFYIAAFVALLNILQWTYGVLTITGDRSVISVKKILSNPVVISFAAGIVLFLLPVSMPAILNGPVQAIAGMNAPLAMIVLGIYLAQVPPTSIFTDRLSYKVAAVRLLLIPALTIALMKLFPAQYSAVKLAVLIVAATPVGSNVAIFAQLYDRDYAQAVREVCLSTVLCIASIPLVVGAANLFL